jgi:DNA-binding NarL/FixJ family response regulator
MINVAVVDDSAIMREGLARLIDADSELQVVTSLRGDATMDGLFDADHVDVVLVDLVADEAEATRRILAADPTARVVVLSADPTPDRVLAAFDAGAIGFLLHDAEPESLRQAVKAASHDESPVDPRVARILVDDRHDRTTHIHLSERGSQILQLAADGMLNKQIARRLGIAEKTVKAHLTRVYERLGVSGRSAAIAAAVELGLVDERRRSTNAGYEPPLDGPTTN